MKRNVGRAAVLLFMASAAVSLSMHACKEPTQVTVDIRTLGFKCSELRKINVVVATTPEATEQKWQFPQGEVGACKGDYEVGTLVITPAGGAGAVMVLASYSDEPCKAPDYVNCIVARRQFTFIEHVPLRLPITLEASCKNVPCNALSSCRSGACVSSNTDCTDDGTCVAPAEPVLSPDGSTIAPPADATIDVPPNDAYVPPDAPPDDAPADSYVPPTDSGSDSSRGTTYGNVCPSMPPQDCNDDNQKVCCAMMIFTCGDRPTDGGQFEGGFQPPTPACGNGTAQWYPCTGKKYCAANEYCCATPGGSNTPYSACGVPFTGVCASGTVLCNTNDDCPPNLLCNQIHPASVYPPDGGNPQLKKCGPP